MSFPLLLFLLSFFLFLPFLSSFVQFFKPEMILSRHFPFGYSLSPALNFFQLLDSPFVSSQPLILTLLFLSSSLLSSSPNIDLSSFSCSLPLSALLCSPALLDLSGSVRSFLSLNSPRQLLPPFNPSSRAGYYVLSRAEKKKRVHWSYHWDLMSDAEGIRVSWAANGWQVSELLNNNKRKTCWCVFINFWIK